MIVIIVAVLGSSPVLFADNRAVWVAGEVTQRPWRAGDHRMIGVDGTAYKILSGIRITHRYLRNPGAYDERSATVDSISTGRKIMIKVRKKDIIQIILF